jgi:hypothetical protein
VFDLIEQTLDGFLGFHLEHPRFRWIRACADDTGTNWPSELTRQVAPPTGVSSSLVLIS